MKPIWCTFFSQCVSSILHTTSRGPSSEGTTVSQPMPYISWTASMNMAPLETPWHYSNILTNHHYNYSIITINSSQNNILMNKILCSNYFTFNIIHHTPPYIPIYMSILTWPNQLHSILHTRQSAVQVHPPIYQLYSYCMICSSFVYLLIWYNHICITLLTLTISLFNNIYAQNNRKPLHQHNCKHNHLTFNTIIHSFIHLFSVDLLQDMEM
jgi:hypothetical protein